ncbi:hypothetical protein D3C80_1760140 [compost metagenome]
MNRQQDTGSVGRINHPSPFRQDRRLSPQQGQPRRRPQSQDQAWFDQPPLLVQPPATRLNLAGVRRSVQPTLAARFVFEMFHGIGQVDFGVINARLCQGGVKHLSRWPDEGLSRQVFMITRLLAYNHQTRLARSLSANALGCIPP